jgi:hypothetical protein
MCTTSPASWSLWLRETAFVSIGAVRIFFRVLLALEVLATLTGGVLAMAAPIEFVPNISSAVPGAAAPELTRLLGVTWIVIALILASVPFLRDVRAMRSILVAIIVGDVLHVGASMAADDVHPATFVLSGVFFAYRCAAVWRPRWLIRTEG